MFHCDSWSSKMAPKWAMPPGIHTLSKPSHTAPSHCGQSDIVPVLGLSQKKSWLLLLGMLQVAIALPAPHRTYQSSTDPMQTQMSHFQCHSLSLLRCVHVREREKALLWALDALIKRGSFHQYFESSLCFGIREMPNGWEACLSSAKRAEYLKWQRGSSRLLWWLR